VEDGHSWPALLARALTGSGFPTREPRVLARTGWTTDDLALAADEAGLDGTYDLVSVLIGVNDQYQGRNLEAFQRGFQGILDRAVIFAGGHPGKVMVLSIPDWGVKPHAKERNPDKIRRQIDRYNVVKQRRSKAAGVSFVDITGISRETGSHRRFQAGDGLHPSEAMYARWVEVALPVAVEILQGNLTGRP